MLPAGRKHGKKTRAARSRTREKPSCRKILTLCKVPERGASPPRPKQRGRAGPGRPDARRNKGRRTSCGRRSARPRRRIRLPDVRNLVLPFPAMSPRPRVRRKSPPGTVFSGERRRCRCRKAAKKKRADAGVLQRRPHSARKSPPGREWTPGAHSLPRRTSPREGPEKARPRGAGPPAPARKNTAEAPRRALARASGRGSRTPLPRRAPQRTAKGSRERGAKGTKKSGRTPPPATESGRAPSVKTTQMRTT